MAFWVRCPIIFSVLFSRSGNLSFLDSNPINRNCWQWAICMHCATHGYKQQCGWLSIMLLAEPLLWKLFFYRSALSIQCWHLPFSLSFLVFPPNKSFKQLFHSALLHGKNVNCSGKLKNELFFFCQYLPCNFLMCRKSHCLYNSAIRDLNNISGKDFI